MSEGDFIAVETQCDNGWWIGTNRATHKRGIFPGAYVEVSGEITEVGAGVKGFAVGDRVFGAPVGGALKPVALMEASRAHKIPDGVDPAIPAGFEMNYGTAYHALHDLAQVQAGERVLVLGASGGVGMAAIDIGVALGAEVVACASTAAKLAACEAAGATTLINYAEGDFKGALKAAGVYSNVDVVYDPVGGALSEVAMRALGWGGRFVVVGFAAGGAS